MATAVALDDRPSAFRYPRGEGAGVDLPEKGEVVIRRQDGTQCRGPAKALRTDGGGVRIEESGPLACDDGSSFTPSVTECQPDTQGRAVCRGLNPDGSEYNVEITR